MKAVIGNHINLLLFILFPLVWARTISVIGARNDTRNIGLKSVAAPFCPKARAIIVTVHIDANPPEKNNATGIYRARNIARLINTVPKYCISNEGAEKVFTHLATPKLLPQ